MNKVLSARQLVPQIHVWRQRGIKANTIVLFDGVCILCIRSVQFIIKRDPGRNFKFCSMQSEVGKELLKSHGVASDAMDTFVVIDGRECLTKSDAVLRIAKRLSGLWSFFSVSRIVPRPIRDWCYDLVARNRYRWFGKRDTCMVPTEEFLDRFIV